MLKIEKRQDGTKYTLALTGRLDANGASQLEKEVFEIIADTEELEFDLEKTEYISSAGLRVLLATHKGMSKRGKVSVTHVSEDVMEIFKMTGFVDILDIK